MPPVDHHDLFGFTFPTKDNTPNKVALIKNPNKNYSSWSYFFLGTDRHVSAMLDKLSKIQLLSAILLSFNAKESHLCF